MPKLIHGDSGMFLNTGIVVIITLYIYVNWDIFHQFSTPLSMVEGASPRSTGMMEREQTYNISSSDLC